MTYLKILMYARAGIQAKIDEYRGMREKARLPSTAAGLPGPMPSQRRWPESVRK